MWIARDADGRLWLYNEKPIKFRDGTWKGQTEFVRTSKMSEDLFPEIKWSDEEPRELVLKPIKEEYGFVNLYKDGSQMKVGWKIFPTKEEAEENFKDKEKYITTTKIQLEEQL